MYLASPFVLFSHSEWEVDKAHYIEQITSRLAPPFFVKPSNTGSSVGVLKVKTFDQLEAAIENAFTYHHKVIVEQGIVGREIEVSVLENIDPRQLPKVSLPGEVVVKDGFYSYEKKYLEPEEVELVMPAPLTSQETKAIQSTAIKSYQALQAESMARVDLFLESGTGNVYFNEMNTLPGFTPISMYPQLWQLSGLPYSELLTQLIELAIARQLRKAKLRTSYLSL